jgi:Tfp pilus assembly protein PilX
MKYMALPHNQRGVTLVVGLIMLVIITLAVTAAFMMSNTNVKAVGNMQFRDQAIAAANVAIEDRIASTFNTAPANTNDNVDLNNDGVTDFAVTLTPRCISSTLYSSAPPSSITLPPSMSAASTYYTLWDIDANVTDANTGTSMEVHSGIRLLLTKAEKTAAGCP